MNHIKGKNKLKSHSAELNRVRVKAPQETAAFVNLKKCNIVSRSKKPMLVISAAVVCYLCSTPPPPPHKQSLISAQSELLTAQRQQLRAVEVQQSPQGWAVCAVLQQVVHWGDPGDQLGGGLLLPVASLHYMKTHSYKPVQVATLQNKQCRLR